MFGLKIVRITVPVETPEEYARIGIWGFSWEHIQRKIKRLEDRNIFVNRGFGPIKEVDEFPDYLAWVE